MSRGYRIQDRTREKLRRLNDQVSKKKWRIRNHQDPSRRIENIDSLIQTIKPGDFQSSTQVQKYIRSMEKFLDRDTQFIKNNSGAIFDLKTANRYKNEVKRINKLIEKEKSRIENIPTQVKGTPLGSTVGEELRRGAENKFPSLKKLSGSLDRFTNQKDLLQTIDQFKKGFFRDNFIRRKDLQYKRNFIQSLETVFGSESRPMQRFLKRMNLEQFMDVYYATLGDIDIDYVYDDNDNLKNRLQTVMSTFGYKKGLNMK